MIGSSTQQRHWIVGQMLCCLALSRPLLPSSVGRGAVFVISVAQLDRPLRCGSRAREVVGYLKDSLIFHTVSYTFVLQLQSLSQLHNNQLNPHLNQPPTTNHHNGSHQGWRQVPLGRQVRVSNTHPPINKTIQCALLTQHLSQLGSHHRSLPHRLRPPAVLRRQQGVRRQEGRPRLRPRRLHPQLPGHAHPALPAERGEAGRQGR